MKKDCEQSLYRFIKNVLGVSVSADICEPLECTARLSDIKHSMDDDFHFFSGTVSILKSSQKGWGYFLDKTYNSKGGGSWSMVENIYPKTKKLPQLIEFQFNEIRLPRLVPNSLKKIDENIKI